MVRKAKAKARKAQKPRKHIAIALTKQFTAGELKAALETMEMTQVEFGRRMDVTPRHVNKWAQGEIDVPRAEGIILRLLVSGKIKLKDLGLVE